MIKQLLGSSRTLSFRIFWLTYLFTVALPLHASNNILGWITIASSYTVIHVILFVLLVKSLFGRSSDVRNYRITLASIATLVLLVSLLISLYTGYSKGYQAVFDFGRYLFMVLFLVLARNDEFSGLRLREFLLLTSYAVLINCLLNCLMDLSGCTIWGLQVFGAESQLGGGYYSLLTVALPYTLYRVLDRDPTFIWLHFLIFFIATIICFSFFKSRTVVFVSLGLCALVLLISLSDVNKNNFGPKFVAILFVLAFAAVGLLILLSSGSIDAFANRILATSFSTGTSDTLGTRIVTGQYYINLAMTNPCGEGLGYHMIKFYSAGVLDFATESVEIDNAYITLAVHLGIPAFFAYLYLTVLMPISRLLNCNASRREKAVIICAYFGLVLSAGLMTSQMIHSYPVVAFVWTFLGLLSTKTFATEANSLDVPSDVSNKRQDVLARSMNE